MPHGGDRPTAEKCVAEAATLVMEVGSGDRVHSSTTEEKVELLKPIVTWKAIIDFLEPNNVCVQRPDDLENARRRVTAIAANATVNVVSRRSDRDRAHCVSWSIGTRDDRTHLFHAGVPPPQQFGRPFCKHDGYGETAQCFGASGGAEVRFGSKADIRRFVSNVRCWG